MSRKSLRAIVLETMCDNNLYIHYLFTGAPRFQNDLKALGPSPLVKDIMNGIRPSKDLPYTVNGRTRMILYYITDKAYKKHPVFHSCYVKQVTRKQRIFNRLREAVRKDMERLYGVLTTRFHTLLRPSRFTTVSQND